jgi:biopolymer transport protein ExbD
MSGSVGSDVKSEPNLTPILDMVFQLITFFMLVINFKSNELDLTLTLPVVGSARPVNEQKILVLNINPKGQLKVYNNPIDNIEKYIRREGIQSCKDQKVTREEIERGEAELKERVIIRADRDTPFAYVNRVVKACQDEGYRKFAFKALSKEMAKGKG